MKSIFKSAILLFSGAAILASPAMAVATSNGDLLVGFYEVIGGVVQSNTYIFDMGKAFQYRENSTNNISVSSIATGPVSANIGLDLSNTFGSDWAETGTVFWTILGGADQTTGGATTTVDGDANRTSYVSRSVATYNPNGVATTTLQTVGTTARGTMANSIESVRSTANNAGILGTNAAGTTIPISIVGSLEEFFPPTSAGGTSLGISNDLRGQFNSGLLAGSPLGADLEGALDVYRVNHNIIQSGYDSTSGFGAANPAIGVGQYIGTFTIDSLGNVAIGVIPEPSALLLGALGAVAGLGLRRRNA